MNSARHIVGFSLVEVLCAIAVLGIGLVGLTQGITGALSSNKEAERQTTAALIAAGQIETLRAEGYILDGVTEGDGGTGLSMYRWTQTITPGSIDGLHEVTIVVAHATTKQVIYELRTMLFDPSGLSDREKARERKDTARSKRGERRER